MCWRRRWSVADGTIPPAAEVRPAAPVAEPRRRGWPASLGGRTAFWLILALMLVQAAGLTIHALDRVDLQRFIQAREIAGRAFGAWRTAVLAPSDRREQMLSDLDLPEGLSVELEDHPAVRSGAPPPPPDVVRLFRLDLLNSGPQRLRPREVRLGPDLPGGVRVAMRLPDGQWLNIRIRMPPPRPWHSTTFLAAFVLMTVAAMLLILGAVARLMRPVRLLAAAADRLGRDVNAPPMDETGPSEVATAARAFNLMAERIRRFVADRTQMLAAIGHDLRTPITRLRLRAEFMDDDEQRRKMLSDLDEMEQMIAATLAFARDDAAAEPASPLDLAALCRTVADEAADAAPECAEAVCYDGPERLTVRARPVAMKRAVANLVTNALKYGGAARIHLSRAENGLVRLVIEDDGPGIPESELEAVFAPFRRLEGSRNRETGGTGLGLTITRNILRAHGGDVVLRNRAGGGLSAIATLPG
ncbi:HAMP domain-containing protein [Roseomonas sp. HJA6]|uniref:histidine kinase n=2 Tax=Roseomonas alba TaxID=2846776 RepID=A0ABS7AIL4_9PROT|nr:HAMP domain-containing protein [Neoroseomonas alba]